MLVSLKTYQHDEHVMTVIVPKIKIVHPSDRIRKDTPQKFDTSVEITSFYGQKTYAGSHTHSSILIYCWYAVLKGTERKCRF